VKAPTPQLKLLVFTSHFPAEAGACEFAVFKHYGFLGTEKSDSSKELKNPVACVN